MTLQAVLSIVGHVDDGSEIFYQVDRSALAVGISSGMRSIPDVVHSSSGTLSEYPNT